MAAGLAEAAEYLMQLAELPQFVHDVPAERVLSKAARTLAARATRLLEEEPS